MQISEFKAKCIAVLKEVQQGRQPLVITLREKPLVRIEPADSIHRQKQLGRLKGRMSVKANLLRKDTSQDWEMLK